MCRGGLRNRKIGQCLVDNGLTVLVNYLEPAYWTRLLQVQWFLKCFVPNLRKVQQGATLYILPKCLFFNCGRLSVNLLSVGIVKW